MMQTYESGTVQSKLAGVKWAEECLDPSWRGLIKKAWSEREGVRFGEKVRQLAQAKLLRDTAEFLACARTRV